MKPRTKLQMQVFALSRQLPALSAEQKTWAYHHCINHVGYRTKKNISCLDCGYVWAGPQKVKSEICSACSVKLKIEDTRKKKLDQYATIALIDVVEDFQVIRFFEIKSYHFFGRIPKQYTREIVQQWFTPDGKLTIVGLTQSFGNGGFSGDLEIRANISNYYSSNKYDLYADKIIPEAKCLPIYKRNGFNSKIEDVQPYSMFKALLRDSKLETLLKANQYSLFSARLSNKSDSVYRFWDSIKICIRNKYIVKDGVSFLDYLDLLSHYRKDLRSPKYVCPANFKLAHHRLIRKRARDQRIANAVRNKQEAERRKLKAEEEQKTYLEKKAPYFGLLFSEGNLTISFLESIQEFIAEADHHQHCVYTNRYYNKLDSLCFSAKVDGKPVETIELSLSKMKIIQSRGMRNEPSKYHDQVIDLMKKNIGVIRKKYNATKVAAA